MKTQDKYPYDPTTTAPYTVFKQVGSNTFFVNSLAILATQKFISVGKEYVLFDDTKETGSKMRNVILANCYYKNGIIHLIVRDIRTQRVFTLDHGIEYPEIDCTWLLIDMYYFKDRENIKAIQSYCDCDADSQMRSNSGIKHKLNYDNNLLDFDF